MQKNNEDSESREKIHSKPKISQSNSGKNQQTKPKIKKTQLTTSQQPWLAKTKESSMAMLLLYCCKIFALGFTHMHLCTIFLGACGRGWAAAAQQPISRVKNGHAFTYRGARWEGDEDTTHWKPDAGQRYTGSHGTDLFVDICVEYKRKTNIPEIVILWEYLKTCVFFPIVLLSCFLAKLLRRSVTILSLC